DDCCCAGENVTNIPAKSGTQNQRISRSLQQNGEPEGSPKLTKRPSSERELQAELELAHADVGFEVLDLPCISGTVNAVISLVAVKPVHRMIEHIECFHPELAPDSLRQAKVLEERHIGRKQSRAAH